MQKNCDLDYTLKSRKSVFGQLFFSLFSTLIFFGFYVFFQFFFMYFITSKIIFSKFGMYLTYKNRFWGHFSWFLGRDINSTVWTRIGSKIKKRVMVFNPHGYRFCGLQGPAFVSFGKISISPSLQTMGESWILSRNQKNASFPEQNRKLGTWGGSGAATKLQSRAN